MDVCGVCPSGVGVSGLGVACGTRTRGIDIGVGIGTGCVFARCGGVVAIFGQSGGVFQAT